MTNEIKLFTTYYSQTRYSLLETNNKMASEKYTEIKGFANEDLQDEIFAAQTQLQQLKFKNATTGLDNPLKIKEMRRDLARLKTEVRARQLAEMTPEQLAKRSRIRARRRK